MDSLFTLLNKSPVFYDEYDEDGELNTLYNNVLFWEENTAQLPAQIQSASSLCLSAADILYNRYYWFTRFMVCYETVYGSIDPGLEQQQFQIIEAMDHESAIDMEECCHILEAIELEVGYHAHK